MHACNSHCSDETLELHGIVCGIIATAHLKIQRFGRRLESFESPSPSRPLSCLSSCKLSTLTGRTEQHTRDQVINPDVPPRLRRAAGRRLHWLQATWEDTSRWSAHVSSSVSISFSPSWINSSHTRPGQWHVQPIWTYIYSIWLYWVELRLGLGSVLVHTNKSVFIFPVIWIFHIALYRYIAQATSKSVSVGTRFTVAQYNDTAWV